MELGPKTLAAIEAHKVARAISEDLSAKMKSLLEVNTQRAVEELTEKLVDDPSLLDEWRKAMAAHRANEKAWNDTKKLDWKATSEQRGAFYHLLQAFVEEHVPHIPRPPHIPENVEQLDR